jgi:hypothetical protein
VSGEEPGGRRVTLTAVPTARPAESVRAAGASHVA